MHVYMEQPAASLTCKLDEERVAQMKERVRAELAKHLPDIQPF